jgi:hypothetical protein
MPVDFPPDWQESLDYGSTVETLKRLEGQELCLFISGGPGVVTGSDGAEAASRIQAKGILRHYDYSWAEGFALGDAARVLLYEDDFVGGDLRTLDPADLFWICIELAHVTVCIGSPGGIETEEFDLFP